MSGTTPTPAPQPAPRPGWIAIVGRVTRGETTIVALYPRRETPELEAPKGDA